MQRYFINEELNKNISIVDKDIIHHLRNVMRNKIGDQIGLIYDSNSSIYIIKEISDNEVNVELISENLNNPELKINIDVATPFLKKDNFELAISKMTECGVNKIIPTNFIRNVVKVDNKWEKKLKRYQDIVKSAAMQSQRNKIPSITDIHKLKDINYDAYDLIITCYENEDNKKISDLKNNILDSKNILVVIGPEGGLDKTEIEFLDSIEHNNIVTLGNRILRSETAQIVSVFYLSMVIEGEL